MATKASVNMSARTPPPAHDDLAWDLEAIKLLLIEPRIASMYIQGSKHAQYSGHDGLHRLGFLEAGDDPGYWGKALLDACRRLDM